MIKNPYEESLKKQATTSYMFIHRPNSAVFGFCKRKPKILIR
jgi:hypothetical protein